MLIKISDPFPVRPSEITSEVVYHDRRHFLVPMGVAAAGAALSGCAPSDDSDTAADARLASLKIDKRTEMTGGKLSGTVKRVLRAAVGESGAPYLGSTNASVLRKDLGFL